MNFSFAKDFNVVGKKMVVKPPLMTHQWWVINFQFFSYKIEKSKLENFVFYIIAFDPIEIKTCSAPQNEH